MAKSTTKTVRKSIKESNLPNKVYDVLNELASNFLLDYDEFVEFERNGLEHHFDKIRELGAKLKKADMKGDDDLYQKIADEIVTVVKRANGTLDESKKSARKSIKESNDFYFEIVFHRDVAKAKEYVKEIYNEFLKKYGYSKNDITWKLTSKGIGFSSSSENIGFDLEDYILDHMYEYGNYSYEDGDYELIEESKKSARKSLKEERVTDGGFYSDVMFDLIKKLKLKKEYYVERPSWGVFDFSNKNKDVKFGIYFDEDNQTLYGDVLGFSDTDTFKYKTDIVDIDSFNIMKECKNIIEECLYFIEHNNKITIFESKKSARKSIKESSDVAERISSEIDKSYWIDKLIDDLDKHYESMEKAWLKNLDKLSDEDILGIIDDCMGKSKTLVGKSETLKNKMIDDLSKAYDDYIDDIDRQIRIGKSEDEIKEMIETTLENDIKMYLKLAYNNKASSNYFMVKFAEDNLI